MVCIIVYLIKVPKAKLLIHNTQVTTRIYQSKGQCQSDNQAGKVKPKQRQNVPLFYYKDPRSIQSRAEERCTASLHSRNSKIYANSSETMHILDPI